MALSAYVCVHLTYIARPRPVGPASLISLPKTDGGLGGVAFRFENPRKVVGDAGAQVGAVDGDRDLQRPLEMPVRRLAPATRMGDTSRHAMHRHRRNRIAGARLEIDRFLDQVAGPVKVIAFESGLSHTNHEVWQELTIAEPPQVLGALGEEPLALHDAALLQQH